jgi:TolB-like protein/Tfp pilus assembly protein PilF
MASLITGYENDIFISYRQNDNKYDGWVTAFVHNLILELEATIKEKVTVYFDINPTDGLLETHSVDKSLEDKLKCLIFIPIISRTYCDKNSFAWQYEFCAFNRKAQGDRFGRDIRLIKGNFASRILPIKIHELDDEDKILLEEELGGPLRSIDFIYKSPGVNRPLGANEDHPHDNINNTYYRDQINKAANAISEILSALKNESAPDNELDTQTGEVSETYESLKVLKGKNKATLKKKTSLRYWILTFWVIAILAVIFKLMYPAIFKNSQNTDKKRLEERISIVVMPFRNMTNDSALNYLSWGGQEGIINHLSFYPDEIKVRPFDLTHSFLKSNNTLSYSSITVLSGSDISRKLDAELFLLGTINKNGDHIRFNSQLIDSKNEEIIKSFQAEGNISNIMYTIDTLAEMVKNYIIVTKLDKKAFKPDPENPYGLHYMTNFPDAYRYHFLAIEAYYNMDYKTAIKLDSQALAIDTNFVGSIVTRCWENFSNGNFAEASKWLLKAYMKRDQVPLITHIKLDYQYAMLFQTAEEQLKYLTQLQKIEDNNPKYYMQMAYQYTDLGKYNESIPYFEKAHKIYEKWDMEPPDDKFYYEYLILAYHRTGQDRKMKEVLQKAEKNLIKDRRADHNIRLAEIFSNAGLFNKSEEYFKKVILEQPGNPNIFYTYATSLINNNLNVSRGLELIDKALELNPNNGAYIDTKAWGLYKQHRYDESLDLLAKAYKIFPSSDIKAHIDSVKRVMNK